MQRKISTEDLHSDLLHIICFFLSTKKLAAFMLTNKSIFEIISKYDPMWKKRSYMHFGNDVPPPDDKDNWYGVFKKNYMKKYTVQSKIQSSIYNMFAPETEQRNQLCFLVRDGNLKELRSKKIEPKDLIKKDHNNKRLIDLAFEGNHQDILDYFYKLAMRDYKVGNQLDTKKIINYTNFRWQGGHTVLHFAVRCNQISHIPELITETTALEVLTEDNFTAIQLACKRIDVLKIILGKYPSLLNQPYNQGCPLLFLATSIGMYPTVDFLLQLGANVFQLWDGIYPIHSASENGYLQIVQLFLSFNQTLLNLPDFDNQTPIILAVRQKKVEVVRFLCKQGAELNKFSSATTGYHYNFTALHWAAELNDWDTVKILIENGASCLKLTSVNYKPSHYATESHIKAFLQLGEFIEKFSLNKNYSHLLFLGDKPANSDYSSLLDAALILKSVCLGHAEKSVLDKYKIELNTEPLTSIYTSLIKYFPTVNSAPALTS